MTRIRHRLDATGAHVVAATAEKFATEHGYRVVIAVVDPWGRVLELTRTDDAQAASSQVAVDKARTAAIFVRPSRDIEAQVSGGRIGALALHGAVALTGGFRSSSTARSSARSARVVRHLTRTSPSL